MKASVPTVLFVCVHNAGRSQMAAAFMEELGSGKVIVRSAGTEPVNEINPVVARAMSEVGIELAGRIPRLLRDDDVRESDVVITMGCGDACPIYPGKHYEDWDLEDPLGKDIEEVREIRDEIHKRVIDLLANAQVTAH